MKYVILKATTDAADYAFPFMFSERIIHADAAKRFIHLVHFDSPFKTVEVLSAGTIWIEGDSFICQPGSETCNIKGEAVASGNAFRDARIFNFGESMGGVLL